MNNMIYPGKPWLDRNGRRIHAHGGSIFYENGTYYWYGENKEFTVPGNGIVQWGIRVYASEDLCNWEDLGLLIPPVTEDPNSLLHPSSKAERPHIIRSAATGKYVCWIKVIRGHEQLALVLTADRFLGPYTIVKEGYKPLGMSMGDFDLAQDDDGRSYLYFEHPHSELICAELTDDCCGVTGNYSVHYPNRLPPYTREAPAHLLRNGIHYLLTSGTTGYHPNPSEYGASVDWHGPFVEQGDLHPQDGSRLSYGSQISSVFRHPHKKDLYIALGDRWMSTLRDMDPEAYDDGTCYKRIHFNFEETFSGDEERKQRVQWTVPPANTSIADYVWLPIVWHGNTPEIVWRDTWSPDEFE